MAGIFDIKTGAFDSSEAAVLHQAYEIALQGLQATHEVDRSLSHRLARSIVKVARGEPDCLRNDGTIDPLRLAQRAILRMLQTSAPDPAILASNSVTANVPGPKSIGFEVEQRRKPSLRERFSRRVELPVTPLEVAPPDIAAAPRAESPGKVMMRLFERTPFAKL